jgi:hypothetical protein
MVQSIVFGVKAEVATWHFDGFEFLWNHPFLTFLLFRTEVHLVFLLGYVALLRRAALLVLSISFRALNLRVLLLKRLEFTLLVACVSLNCRVDVRFKYLNLFRRRILTQKHALSCRDGCLPYKVVCVIQSSNLLSLERLDKRFLGILVDKVDWELYEVVDGVQFVHLPLQGPLNLALLLVL